MRGRFISVEGLDGTGKSTLCSSLSARLREAGLLVHALREPGGTPAGERIRTILADPDTSLTPRAELLLFSAARAELVETVVEPALAEGTWILLDRFTDSTLAYQGAGRQLGDAPAAAAADLATAGLRPDRTLLLTAPADVRHARLQARGDAAERWELADPSVVARIEARYAELVVDDPARVREIDATGTPDAVAKLAWNATEDLVAAAVAG